MSTRAKPRFTPHERCPATRTPRVRAFQSIPLDRVCCRLGGRAEPMSGTGLMRWLGEQNGFEQFVPASPLSTLGPELAMVLQADPWLVLTRASSATPASPSSTRRAAGSARRTSCWMFHVLPDPDPSPRCGRHPSRLRCRRSSGGPGLVLFAGQQDLPHGCRDGGYCAAFRLPSSWCTEGRRILIRDV